MPFLEIRNLEKRFGNVDVLKGINLAIDEGGFLVLVGPSGCGKSTLLNTIAGLETITAGEIHIKGRKVNDLHPSERDMAEGQRPGAPAPHRNPSQPAPDDAPVRLDRARDDGHAAACQDPGDRDHQADQGQGQCPEQPHPPVSRGGARHVEQGSGQAGGG